MPSHPHSPAPEIVQVLLELDSRREWSRHSLELLGDGRTLAASLGGFAGGWALSAPTESRPEIHSLAAHGCRRLRCLEHARFAHWSSEAIAAALAGQLAAGCLLILIPGTPRGEEVAALLAGKLRTAWIPDTIGFSALRNGAFEISAILPGGKVSRTFRPAAKAPVVVTMRAGVAEVRPDRSTEIECDEIEVKLDGVPQLTAEHGFVAADPKTVDLVFADRIVSAGRGTGGPEGVALVAKLAEALGASLGGSRVAVDLGWVPSPRQIGQTGRTVSPELYVACGISGASHHLLGMRESKHIVAINPDAKAPIHDVAHLSLPGDLHKLVPAIVEILERRTQETGVEAR